jgi:hypothetical protein
MIKIIFKVLIKISANLLILESLNPKQIIFIYLKVIAALKER